MLPPVSQQRAWPFLSVTVITVLLKVALMWKTPRETLFLTFFLPVFFATPPPLLLLGHQALRTFTSPGVSPRLLAADREIASMPNPAVAPDL